MMYHQDGAVDHADSINHSRELNVVVLGAGENS
jgi:hypothetical protein